MGLSIEIKKNVENEIKGIIEETTQFDFPFFISQEKKKDIIFQKKSYIEEKLRRLSPDTYPSEEALIQMWGESIKHSDEQFNSLSEKHKLNGFYLQELSHCYAEKIGIAILDNI